MNDSRLTCDRIPGSVDEARTLVAYNERIIATSQSAQRRARAERMLANLGPHLTRLEREEQDRLARIEASSPPAHDYEVVWSGSKERAGETFALSSDQYIKRERD